MNTLIRVFSLYRKKIFISLAITFSCFLISLIVSFMQTDLYRSSSTFLPISSNSITSELAQYASLAAMAGINVPRSGSIDNSQKILTILASRTMREKIIDKLGLVDLLVTEVPKNRTRRGVAVEKLDKLVRLASGKNNEIELIVDFPDPIISQKINQEYIIELERSLNSSNLAISQKEQHLNEIRLTEQNKRLQTAQRKLSDFQKKNKILDPNSQIKGYTELFSELYSKKIELQIQLSQFEVVYNSDDTRIAAVESQIKSIEEKLNEIQTSNTDVGGMQFQRAPELMIEFQNLYRDVEVQTKLYAAIFANLSQSALTKNDDKVFVELIDPPMVPEVRASPNRLLFVIVGTSFGLIMSFFLVILWESINLKVKTFLGINSTIHESNLIDLKDDGATK